MSTKINLGALSGNLIKIAGHRSINYQKIDITGGKTFSHIAGKPWEDLFSYMIQWKAARKPMDIKDLGSRLLIDFSGTKNPDKGIQIHLVDADPSLFQNYTLTKEAFEKHNSDNVLYHIANQKIDKYPFVANISGHASSNEDFFVFTDGNPSQPIHSLIVAKGEYTSPSGLTPEIWRLLGSTIEKELDLLNSITAITKWGYRLEMGNGFLAQAIPQMHIHLKAGDLDKEPIT